ncbi:hypothetical protein EGW08_003435 [Elysia chlorotica]|uniref:Uncharacterized protein n=1 Tax=Elysia chlorotica TaxID=188477 RepID=A0A433U4R1_ELYCH|nr:hypothetical protein EGW08_003435 [Elysia chlorotica]
MTIMLKDVVSKLVLLVVLVAPRTGASDESKDWLWKLLTSHNENPDSLSSSYNGDGEISPNLQDLLSKSSQLRLDPSFLADLKQQLSAEYLVDREKELGKRQFGGGLLCCNHPPTRPPSPKSLKRAEEDERVKDWLISQLFDGSIRPGGRAGSAHASRSGETSYHSTPDEDGEVVRNKEPFWRDGDSSSDRHQMWAKRGKVTEFLRKSRQGINSWDML